MPSGLLTQETNQNFAGYNLNQGKYNNYSSNTTMIEHRSNPFIEPRSSLKNSVVSQSNSYERSISYHQYQEKLKNDNRHYESKLKNLKDKILALQVTGPLNSQLNSHRLYSAKNGSLGMMITPTVRDLNG
jgi:hypothetical protein